MYVGVSSLLEVKPWTVIHRQSVWTQPGEASLTEPGKHAHNRDESYNLENAPREKEES